jgi:uncharacterized 2Fe-2S/4Fe-4S cluster protein (DUF4445 family)
MGNGACGLCAVHLHHGAANAPTSNERLHLSKEQLDSGQRLACQLTVVGDAQIAVDAGPSDSGPSGSLSIRVAEGSRSTTPASTKDRRYGLAIDVGTTHVRVSLCDLQSGNRVAGRVVDNPQSRSGADVMTRLIAAGRSVDAAQGIAQVLIDAISDAVVDVCTSIDLDPSEIDRVCAVGNTPMLMLLTMTDPRALSDPRSWTRPIECSADTVGGWGRSFGIAADASAEAVQPLAGFVGSDLLAAVLATRLVEGPRSLLIDFGTNSEIALWDGGTLWVTSAAGGPAFESCGLSSGMPAEKGAISSVVRKAGSGELRCEVIGGGPVKGMCGSAFVDLVAILRRTGELSPVGRLRANREEGFVFDWEGAGVRLTNQDVDTLQRAKAAIGTGVQTLLGMADTAQADIERVCVCGAFGRRLDVGNAKSIGLLPDVPDERFELWDDAALSGCERLLVAPASASELRSLRAKARIANLAQTPDFDSLFLENLYLRSLGETQT